MLQLWCAGGNAGGALVRCPTDETVPSLIWEITHQYDLPGVLKYNEFKSVSTTEGLATAEESMMMGTGYIPQSCVPVCIYLYARGLIHL